MTLTLSTDTAPGTDFELTGTAYRVEDAMYYKQESLRVRALVSVNGQTMFADIRLVPEAKGFWNTASADIEKAHADPAAEQQRADEAKIADADNVSALDPTDVDQMTVRQLRTHADEHGIELPTSGKKAELLTIVKDATAQPEAEAA